MSAIRSLRLRKQHNALQRQAVTRLYSAEASGTSLSITPKEQADFLQAQDQASLREVQWHLGKKRDQVKKIKAQITALPTTIPVLVGVKSLSQGKANYGTETIPYTTGLLRHNVRETTRLAQPVISSIEHLNEHLNDLQYEPYPSESGKPSALAQWQAEISKMSRQEKEDLFKTMQLEEEADKARLKQASSGLMQTVRRLEEMDRQKPSFRSAEEPATSERRMDTKPFIGGNGLPVGEALCPPYARGRRKVISFGGSKEKEMHGNATTAAREVPRFKRTDEPPQLVGVGGRKEDKEGGTARAALSSSPPNTPPVTPPGAPAESAQAPNAMVAMMQRLTARMLKEDKRES